MEKVSYSDKVLRVVIVIFLCVFSIVALIPLVSVAAKSFSSKLAVDSDMVSFWPVGLTLDSWAFMLKEGDLWRSFLVSLVSTLIATFLCLLVNILMAYPLTKKEFPIAKVLLLAIVISMIFKAPLIPYFLTVKGIGLYDNPLALVIPHLISEFNLLIMITFMRQFPPELEEAAVVEGAGYFRRLFRIVLPLSKASLATLGLFYAVVIWNQFQTPLLFIQSPKWYPLQTKIRQMITDENALPVMGALFEVNYNAATLQSVAIVFAVIPILFVYPALQKYFAKGAMIGSVKG
ncbi:MAG: carbohydrate ABC transporter permease [Treponema sp.]|jgi:putative aldouronate transport system permease protein|nr:carbohydrate ABC transporter permease [Treponema sp.]